MHKRTLVLTIALVIAFGLLAAASQTILIIDSAGRVVEIPYPIERVVVLNSGSVGIIRSLGAADRIVGISTIVARNPAFWGPIAKLPQVGGIKDINFEAVIALQPQLVLNFGTHPAVNIEEIARKLAPAGIAVAGIDSFRFATLYQDIATLGRIFGNIGRAGQLIAFYQDILDLVAERVAGLMPEEKVRVYAEHHAGQFRSFGSGSDWHKMIGWAGGVNIFADTLRPFVTVDPETVLERNPQIILQDSRRAPLGHGVIATTPLTDYLAVFVDRPGWEQIAAVRDERVYLVSPAIGSGTGKFIGTLFFARIFYPELFADIDPERVLQEYYRQFHGQTFNGIFVYPQR
ncbi:ABC transporter substrate-binding protein [Candidatus Acetothermia bacterium]|nr:ABC transporter substrate-binding protein [Candidatus Acetothermia bacterium]